MSDFEQKGVSQKTTDFLFGEHTVKALSNLDIRTDVATTEMFELLHYYQILATLGSDVAGKLKDQLEALLISVKREGRKEGVAVLQTKTLPKTEKMYSSVEGGTSEPTS